MYALSSLKPYMFSRNMILTNSDLWTNYKKPNIVD